MPESDFFYHILVGEPVNLEIVSTSLFQLGAACLALLLVIRGFNTYGETLPWTTGETPVDTLISMLIYALHLYVLLIFYKIVLVTVGPNEGYLYHISDVWQIWCITAILAFVLYFPTRAFGQYKRQTDKAWVKYF